MSIYFMHEHEVEVYDERLCENGFVTASLYITNPPEMVPTVVIGTCNYDEPYLEVAIDAETLAKWMTSDTDQQQQLYTGPNGLTIEYVNGWEVTRKFIGTNIEIKIEVYNAAFDKLRELYFSKFKECLDKYTS
jgi:hypothetical protein